METKTTPRIPNEENGIQYNHCKAPGCDNFGVPASQEKKHGNNTYIVVGKNRGEGTTNIPLLKCNCCGEISPMKSNYGISQELDRISAYLTIAKQEVYCPHEGCANNTVPVGTKKAYRSFGTSSSGSKRYQCCACLKTFSVAKPTQWQHDTHLNIEIFKQLMNKVPLNRIVHMLNISWSVLYNRIDFIHKQCLAFASNRENKLQNMLINRVYLAVDRQEYHISWANRKDKRNTVISAVASGDNLTGYIFGMHPNFDYNKNKDDVEKDAVACGDYLKSAPFRKYAHVWLDKDYENSVISKNNKRKKSGTNLIQEIQNTYDHVVQREDVESFDNKTNTEKLPDYGVQTKAEYTMIAHFYLLKKIMPNVEKWRFFLDQDSGIRGAFMSAFANEVKEKKAEAFYVRIEKDLTVDEKRKLKALANKKLKEISELKPHLSESDIKIEILKEEIQSVLQLGSWRDKWVKHPFPNMAEANKAMCWLTEHNEFDDTHKAWLYNKASLHGVDSYFQKVRRRLAMMERPISSSSNTGRVWNGYGAYKPSMVVKMLDMYRVVHNYIDVRKEDKTTPAMRVGLAQAPLDYKTVLYNE